MSLIVILLILVLTPLAAFPVSVDYSQAEQAWFYAHDAEMLQTLELKPETTVVLPLQQTSEDAPTTASPLHYRYEVEGEYTWCVDGDEPYITQFLVADPKGLEIVSIGPGECAHKTLTPGVYTQTVLYDGTNIPPEGTVAFLQQPTVNQTRHPTWKEPESDSNSLLPRYPAFSPIKVVETDPRDEIPEGLMLAAQQIPNRTPFDWYLLRGFDPKAPAATAYTHQQRHLFSFENTQHGQAQYDGDISLRNGDSSLDNFQYKIHSQDCNRIINHKLVCTTEQNEINSVIDLPMWNKQYPKNKDKMFSVNLNWKSCLVNIQCFSLIAFHHNSSTNGYSIHLAENNHFAYPVLESKITQSEPTFFSVMSTIRFYRNEKDKPALKDGEVAFFEGKDYTGKVYVLSDSVETTELIWLPSYQSIQFGGNVTALLHGDNNYHGTPQVVASNIRSFNQKAGEDIRSIKLIYSKKELISTKQCRLCDLAGIDLSGLNLAGVDLTGAVLHGANLTNANLDGANLYGAFLNGNHVAGATLQGAFMRNVNLSHANIAGADFQYASFFSSTPTTCQPETSAHLECASAFKAKANAVKFQHAFLSGVDFSSADLRGANFSGAVLIGADFTNASLTPETTTKSSVDFTDAFLQGAKLDNAQSVRSANFKNTYVDIDNNIEQRYIRLLLPGYYTRFSNYWGSDKGDDICVQSNYVGATRLPKLDETNFCPNGKAGPCSEQQWTSPEQPMEKAMPPVSDHNTGWLGNVCRDYEVDDKWYQKE